MSDVLRDATTAEMKAAAAWFVSDAAALVVHPEWPQFPEAQRYSRLAAEALRLIARIKEKDPVIALTYDLIECDPVIASLISPLREPDA